MDGFPVLIELAAFKGHRLAAYRATRWLCARHSGLQWRLGCTRDRRPEKARGSVVYSDWKVYRPSLSYVCSVSNQAAKGWGGNDSGVALSLPPESIERLCSYAAKPVCPGQGPRWVHGCRQSQARLAPCQPSECRFAEVSAIAKPAENGRPITRQPSPPVDFRGATALVPG
jgi:hypothetical protein